MQYLFSLKRCSNDDKSEVQTSTLSNDDLPRIINCFHNDPIKKPILLCATPRKIFNGWMKVGFVPFTCNALTHNKVCHTLGDGDPSIDMAAKLMNLQDSYQKLKHGERIFKFIICFHYFLLSSLNHFILSLENKKFGINNFYLMKKYPCTKKTPSSKDRG